MTAACPLIYGQDQIIEGASRASNRGCSLWSQWLERLLLLQFDSGRKKAPGAMVTGDGGAQARATDREMMQRLFLRDLEENRVPFYSLLAGQMIHWGLAAAAWSSQSLTASHNLVVLLQLREVALKLCLDPLKLLLGSIALDGSKSNSRSGYVHALGFGVCGAKSNEHGSLFIGLLVLTRRGCGVLSFLSLNQTHLGSDGKIWKGERNRVRFNMVIRIPGRVSWP
jgi:hypothetical protein